MRALILSVAAAVLAQAPWPQPDGSASHSRAVHPAWPRDATLLTQLSAVPFCSPVLIGANGTLYGAASDGLLHAFEPSGRELWATPLDAGTGTCSLALALDIEGRVLTTYLPGTSAAIGIYLLDRQEPLRTLFFPNSTVFQVAVSEGLVVTLAGLPEGESQSTSLVLYCYDLQGQTQWSFEFPNISPFISLGSAFAVSRDTRNLFIATELEGPSGNVGNILAAFSLSSVKLLWKTFPVDSLRSASLMAPND